MGQNALFLISNSECPRGLWCSEGVCSTLHKEASSGRQQALWARDELQRVSFVPHSCGSMRRKKLSARPWGYSYSRRWSCSTPTRARSRCRQRHSTSESSRSWSRGCLCAGHILSRRYESTTLGRAQLRGGRALAQGAAFRGARPLHLNRALFTHYLLLHS